MLASNRLIFEETFAVPDDLRAHPPLTCALEIVGILNDLFMERPKLLRLPGDTALTLLYRDVAYQERDIMDSVGCLAARISHELPIRFLGSTNGRETAEMTVQMRDSQTAVFRRHAISDRPVGRMRGLGIHMEFPGPRTLEYLTDMIGAMTPGVSLTGVVSKKQEQFLRDDGLLLPTEGSLFSYFSREPDVSQEQLLYLLTAEHKMLLWQAFLEDYRQPLEFDWLWDSYYGNELSYILEWELALRMILEKLSFRLEHTENSYRLMDNTGRERRFDFEKGGAAEKVFLKLLFPVDNH